MCTGGAQPMHNRHAKIGRTINAMPSDNDPASKGDGAGALSRDSTLGDGPGREPGQPLTKAPRKDPFSRVVAVWLPLLPTGEGLCEIYS